MICMEGHKNTFHFKCAPSSKAGVAGDSSSVDRGIGDRTAMQ